MKKLTAENLAKVFSRVHIGVNFGHGFICQKVQESRKLSSINCYFVEHFLMCYVYTINYSFYQPHEEVYLSVFYR